MRWRHRSRKSARRGTRRFPTFEQVEFRIQFDANSDDACEQVCVADGPNGSNGGAQNPATSSLPDFTLTDVNAGSPRTGQGVSPRDYLQQLSVWYFGHAN